MDGFDKDSFAGVTDTILYNIMWEDWDQYQSAGVNGPNKGTPVQDETSLSDDGNAPRKKTKAEKELADTLFPSDEEVGRNELNDVEGVPSKSTSRVGSPSSESEGPLSRASSTRPTTVFETNKRPVSMMTSADAGRKHNLRELADGGQGGRVMFVFERISASKL